VIGFLSFSHPSSYFFLILIPSSLFSDFSPAAFTVKDDFFEESGRSPFHLPIPPIHIEGISFFLLVLFFLPIKKSNRSSSAGCSTVFCISQSSSPGASFLSVARSPTLILSFCRSFRWDPSILTPGVVMPSESLKLQSFRIFFKDEVSFPVPSPNYSAEAFSWVAPLFPSLLSQMKSLSPKGKDRLAALPISSPPILSFPALPSFRLLAFC